MNGEKARDETKDQSKEKADQAGPPREAPKDMIRRTLLGSGGDQ